MTQIPKGEEINSSFFFGQKRINVQNKSVLKMFSNGQDDQKGKDIMLLYASLEPFCSLSKKEPIYLVYICITFSLDIMYTTVLE